MKRILILIISILVTGLFSETVKVKLDSEYLIGSVAELNKYNSNFGSTTLPRTYKLPAKQINIVLPPAIEIIDYSVSLSNFTEINEQTPQKNGAYSNGETIIATDKIIENDAHYQFRGLKHWGNLCYASFDWYPVTYVNGEYSLVNSASIDIEFLPQKDVNRIILKEVVSEDFFVNKEDIVKNYYLSRDVNYLIIGQSANEDNFAEYIQFRENQGMSADYVDIETILANGTGANDVEKLRNYLIQSYNDSPFAYLMLIGDPSIIPLPYLSSEPGVVDEIASDFYYSDLTSNFDSDNDNILGEYSADGISQDAGMDFTPEVFVGRIPWNDSGTIGSILDRIINFEQSEATWKDDALFPMSYLNYENQNNEPLPNSNYAATGEYLKDTVLRNNNVTAMYEEEGVVPSSPEYPSDIPLTFDNLVTELNENNFGFISWAGHGSPTYSIRTVWFEDSNNDGIPAGNDELVGAYLVNADMWESLTNTQGAIFFGASCLNGKLDYYETSVAENLIKYKAVANIAATRTSWYKVGWQDPGYGGLQSYNTHIIEYMYRDNYSYGKAHGMGNFLHTNFYLFGDPTDTGGIIHPELRNMYTHMMFGDPAVNYQADDEATDGQILILDKTPDQRGIKLVNALNDNYNYSIVYTNKLIPDYDIYNRFEAIFGLNNYGDTSGDPLLNWQVDLLNNYYTNDGTLYFENFFYSQNQISTDFDISNYTYIVDIVNPLTPLNGLTGNWNYTGLYYQVNPISANGTPILGDGTNNFMYLLNNSDNNIIVSAIDLIGLIDENDYSNFTSFMQVMNIHQPVSNDDVEVASQLNVSNYPNPFNPETTISFNVGNEKEALLVIYNLKGQRVYSQTKKELVPGRNSITWNGNNNSGNNAVSGIYFYKVVTKTKSEYGKMMLIK